MLVGEHGDAADSNVSWSGLSRCGSECTAGSERKSDARRLPWFGTSQPAQCGEPELLIRGLRSVPGRYIPYHAEERQQKSHL